LFLMRRFVRMETSASWPITSTGLSTRSSTIPYGRASDLLCRFQ
jgi:hypothetical protein